MFDEPLPDWIRRLPILQLLRDSITGQCIDCRHSDAFRENDILFGHDNILGIGVNKYLCHPTIKKVMTYREWFGNWIGYQGELDEIRKRASFFLHTPAEISFFRAILSSRYNFATVTDTNNRLSKASKALLEFVLFHQEIRKIHFILDDTGEPFQDDGSHRCLLKNPTLTHHELRHLHRLALRYPNPVAQKVVCWDNFQQVQLPAKVKPGLWMYWTPRLKNINTRPVYPAQSHL